MTSTSMFSRSESVPEALSVGGGGSMAAAFFLFFAAKKLPKKPLSLSPPKLPSASVGLAARAGVEPSGLPVFGSTCTGLGGLCRSFTMAIAWEGRLVSVRGGPAAAAGSA